MLGKKKRRRHKKWKFIIIKTAAVKNWINLSLKKTTTTKTATKLRTCSFISKLDDRNRTWKKEIKAVAVVKYTCIYVFI